METLAPADGTLEALGLSEGYGSLGPAFVERLDPTPMPAPKLVAFNPAVGAMLGIAPAEAERPEFTRLAAGCARFGAVKPFAALYSGHQFGSYNPQLGDGRAITLAEVAGPAGPLEWQLKGAGPTAFSRMGDGRAVLRSTIREFLASEAMAALGIPTTRALAMATAAEIVYRETPETAAVLSRIAPSHLRFGHFEIFHYRKQFEHVATLADYAIERFFPEVAGVAAGPERYAAFFHSVATRTARLIAQWQAVGFAHGVMNTDNMSLLGLTLDYGPYGFLDAYVPNFICNHSDDLGRYAFDRQPSIGAWNVRALGEALSTLVSREALAAGLVAFAETFEREILERMRAKFGLAEPHADDDAFVQSALDALERNGTDFTRFFRLLSQYSPGAGGGDIAALFIDAADWNALRSRYDERLARETRGTSDRHAAMRAVNPAYVLRNYLAQEAIAAAERDDYGPFEALWAALRSPFEERSEWAHFAEPPPPGSGAVVVSCSS